MSKSEKTRSDKTRDPIDLPPGFRLVTLRESGDAFAHAAGIAAQSGAGTVTFTRRFDLVEFAVVLEPDEPLRSARRAVYAGMTALADALAAHCPPEKPIAIEWPGALLFDGGLVGGGRLAWPAGADEARAPDWLVFGAMLRVHALRAAEPGLRATGTALAEEGFGEVDAGRILESFCRHLMVATDEWLGDGFPVLAQRYFAWAPDAEDARRAIDVNGDLLLRRDGERTPRREPLLPALAAALWLDPERGTPKL